VPGAELPDDQVIRLEGTVGFSVACELRSIAMNAAMSSKSVTFDCSKVDRFDLSALQILQALKNQLAQSGTRLHITGVSDSILDYVRLAGFEALFRKHGP
jgi:anti-anti-sigma regulatory factor